jgi:hypothetical protein
MLVAHLCHWSYQKLRKKLSEEKKKLSQVWIDDLSKSKHSMAIEHVWGMSQPQQSVHKELP